MDRTPPTLCEPPKCTACSACANICPNSAISMEEDEYGELHPSISADRCTKCGLCERVCPELERTKLNRYGSPDIYSCWLKSADDRKESTSGGAAYAISKSIIAKGGHVWGAAYTDGLSLRYVEANTIEELQPQRKSKYVQCYVADCFKKIKQELDAGELVLFCGTACHVKGLRFFLRKDYDNLYTIDLVCHGVPGQGVFRKYVDWLEKRYGDQLIDFEPRHKGSDGQEVLWCRMATFKRNGKVKIRLDEDGYFTGFQHNIFLRDNCFNCTSNGEFRYADFTVGDFWGIDRLKNNRERCYGISMLALNSEKAKKLFESFSDLLIFERRTYTEASVVNTQYFKSATSSPYRQQFRNEWQTTSWELLSKKYLRYSIKERLLFIVRKHFPLTYMMLNHYKNGHKRK